MMNNYKEYKWEITMWCKCNCQHVDFPRDNTSQVHIAELDLDTRSFNLLQTSGIKYVSQLVSLVNEDPDNILRLKNVGSKSFRVILRALYDRDLINNDKKKEVERALGLGR